MKSVLRNTMAVFAITSLFASCSKDKKTTPTNTLPPVVNTIVSQAQIDTLKKNGTVINEGTTPPNVSGEFLLSPDICSFDNSPGKFAGLTFDDYVYKFSNLNTAKFTIRVDYHNIGDDGVDMGTDSTATYVSGNGQFFTVYSKSSGVEAGVTYGSLQVISGQLTSSGIANFQITDFLESKGPDPQNKLEPVNSTRIFYDSDNISGPYTGSIQLGAVKTKTLDAAIHTLTKAMRSSKK